MSTNIKGHWWSPWVLCTLPNSSQKLCAQSDVYIVPQSNASHLPSLSPLLQASLGADYFFFHSASICLPWLFFLPAFDKQCGEVKSIWVSKLDTLESESYVTIHSFIYSFTICIVSYTVIHVLTLLDISCGLWGSFITLLRIYFLIHKLGILLIVNIYWVFARCQASYLYYLILYPQQPCKVFTIFTSTL